MTDLSNLLARVEAATEADRALDAEIAASVKAFPPNAPSWLQNWAGEIAPAPKVNYGAVAAWQKNNEMSVCWNAPHYTRSVDAALTLIPEHLNYLTGRGRTRATEPLYGAVILDGDTEAAKAENDHGLALAIVAAALKARML